MMSIFAEVPGHSVTGASFPLLCMLTSPDIMDHISSARKGTLFETLFIEGGDNTVIAPQSAAVLKMLEESLETQ